MLLQQESPSSERKALEMRAAAALEIERRRKIKLNSENTVYGIVDSKEGVIRCWQDVNGVMTQVDKEPVCSIPAKIERCILTKAPIIVLDGGRGSGKSESVSGIMACRIKDYGSKVGCFREFQNSISDSVHSIIRKKINNLSLSGFTVGESKIDHDKGGSARYRGLARNPEGVKSMDAFSDFWVEEAQTISARSLELIEPTLRSEGSQIWYTLNRGSSADAISREHLKPYDHMLSKHGIYEDENILIIRINYIDNPWFPDNLEKKRTKNKANWSAARYDHVWNGAYMDEVESSIIKSEWFDAAIDAHKLDRLKEAFKPHGAVVATHDPSDDGSDAKGYSLRHGSIIKRVLAKDDGEIDQGCDWATDLAIEDGADWFVWDCDGMGTGLKRQVATAFKGKKVTTHMFKGSLSGSGQDNADDVYMVVVEDDNSDEKPKPISETFTNNRSQYSIKLADRFYNTYKAVVRGDYIDPNEMISIDSEGVEDIERLRSEVCRVPRKNNNTGLIQIMSKQEMKKLGIESPNMYDSIMMSMFMPKIKKARKKLDYQKMSIA